MSQDNESIRYEPEEPCPPSVALAVGVQGVALVLAPMVVNVAIVFRAAGQPESYLAWAVVAALIVCGVTTALQATRLGRLGAGHLIITGPGPIFIAVCIAALTQGGPALMGSLVVVASLVQFALSMWLPALRRIITPVVSGTVIMLIAYTIVPIALDLLDDLPDGTSPGAAPCIAGATLAVATAMALRASGALRLWSPLIGIGAGCTVAAAFGVFDTQSVRDAPWVGFPSGQWHGLDLTPGAEFWALLPVFIVVTVTLAINSVSDGIVVQTTSRRKARATDFRIVQGTLNANGIGVALAGVAGTVPTMGYTAANTSLVSLTGVAARSVGYAIGAILVGLALLPKLAALLLIIPPPVVGTYFIILMALLFVAGARTVVQDGFDVRSATIAGVAFWLGVGAENEAIFADRLEGVWQIVLGNGMTVGAIAAIAMTLFVEWTGPRRSQMRLELHPSALPAIDAFLSKAASKIGWDAQAAQRLRAAGEETLAIMLAQNEEERERHKHHLIVNATHANNAAVVEFLAAHSEENLEDRVSYLSEEPEASDEREVSFRLLRHYAASVKHRQYHGIDVVTIQVDGPNDRRRQ